MISTIHARRASAEADHAESMPVFHLRFDEAEELNGGDVVALVVGGVLVPQDTHQYVMHCVWTCLQYIHIYIYIYL